MTEQSNQQKNLNLNAQIYPVSSTVFEPDEEAAKAVPLRDVGVCFSGGGSRSLSAVMGQLRGLKQQGWLDRVGTISAVSGGCWASSLYIFLPETISYDDFLGTGVPPEQLLYDAGNIPQSISYLPPDNMGHVPTRLGWDELFRLYEKLKEQGYNDWNQLWRVAMGELVFKDFGLYQPDADQNPTHFYSWSEDYFKKTIAPHNPNLDASDFHFARNPWPWLIMNGSMFYPQDVNSLIPVVSNFFYSGIRGNFPQPGQGVARVAGGGFVDSYGFGSQFISNSPNAPDRINIQQPRPFSVVDMAAISSTAFAEEFWNMFGLKDLEPEYNYWPVAGGGAVGELYEFADGGLLENSGLADLLANTSLKKAVVFVNGSQAVEHDLETWDYIQVPDCIPPLFGYQPIRGLFDRDGYKLYVGDAHPKAPLMKNNQIFESNRFQELLDGLKQATNNFENTAMYFQRGLQLQENSWYGITPKQTRSVDVLWICNNRVNSWESQITDPTIKHDLDVRIVPDTGLWNFPYYGTLDQLNLTAPQVNMLAQLSWWNVTANQNQSVWKQIFG